jgi:serine/threonine protein phosphatase PrpC
MAVISTFYLNRDIDEVDVLPVCRGSAVLWSRRCPTKNTPNEDAAAVIVVDETTAILAIADGVGGVRSGDVAAKIAVESLGEAFEEEVSGENSVRAGILNGIERANQRILDLGIGAATTMAVLEISRRDVRPYHVGDSVILIFGARGKIKWQTIMHSPVGFAFEAGMLDESEALRHKDRHLVSNVVGAGDMRIEIGPSIPLAARDTVLLASDGLIDNLTVDEIIGMVRTGSLEKSIAELSHAARQRMLTSEEGHPSKPDDATILAFRPPPLPPRKKAVRTDEAAADAAAVTAGAEDDRPCDTPDGPPPASQDAGQPPDPPGTTRIDGVGDGTDRA